MATATATNELVVVKVGRDSMTVAVNGQNKVLGWDALRRAASAENADAGLRKVYAGVLAEAEAMAADGPLTVEVRQDSTDVWWVVSVRSYHGGGYPNWKRKDDEGGTHPHRSGAAFEAREICKRLGGRVTQRIGF